MTETNAFSIGTAAPAEDAATVRGVDRTIQNMSKRAQSYRDQKDVRNLVRLREVLETLPGFAKSYFRAVEATTSTATRLSYAYDLRTFFRFLQETRPAFADPDATEWTVDVLDRVKAEDVAEYLEYLKEYDPGEKAARRAKKTAAVTNGANGLKRKASALRSFYAYFFRRQMIATNPAVLVDVPKVRMKAATSLGGDVTAALLAYIERGGEDLSGQKKAYREKTRVRDLAIATLLLGTGIRASECVGLDVQDVDFRERRVAVARKGGSETSVLFGEEVETALLDYLEVRERISPEPGHERALFLSTRRKRMGAQAIENMLKKYAEEIGVGVKVTPRALRGAYAAAAYRETGDVCLVADALGNGDVNWTRKRYADADDDRERRAAPALRLRKN